MKTLVRMMLCVCASAFPFIFFPENHLKVGILCYLCRYNLEKKTCMGTVALEALQNEVIREVLNVRDISVLKKVKKMLLPEGGADAVAEEVLGEL